MTKNTLVPDNPAAVIRSSGKVLDLDDPKTLADLLNERRSTSRRADNGNSHALTPTRQKILAMMAWANDQQWPGKSGNTDLYAYLAFLGVAYGANKTYVGMSQYELAVLIGVSNKTAWLSMRRLERRGLIKRDTDVLQDDVTPSKPRADRYYLGEPNLLHNYVSQEHTILLVSLDSRTYATRVPDLFKTKEGLSKAALRVYDALDLAQAQKAAELARKLKRNRSSVGRNLRRLEGFELAREIPEGWLKSNADLEQLAAEQGTAQAIERTLAYYESLREGYRAYLERKESHAEGVSEARFQSRQEPMVSRSRASVPTDGRAALPNRAEEPVQSDYGQRAARVGVEGMGHAAPDALAQGAGRPHARGGRSLPIKSAACVGCGQVQEFSAPDLRPYSCAYCKGRFEFVDELAMAVA